MQGFILLFYVILILYSAIDQKDLPRIHNTSRKTEGHKVWKSNHVCRYQQRMLREI